MKVLLDTCVISELRRPNGNQEVARRVAELDPNDVYLSVITLGELIKGVALLPNGHRRREFSSWVLGIQHHYADQILSIDAETALVGGEMTARAQRQGAHVPASDGLIAATAIRHGLHVMTRNSKDFVFSGALIIDPWNE